MIEQGIYESLEQIDDLEIRHLKAGCIASCIVDGTITAIQNGEDTPKYRDKITRFISDFVSG